MQVRGKESRLFAVIDWEGGCRVLAFPWSD